MSLYFGKKVVHYIQNCILFTFLALLMALKGEPQGLEKKNQLT